jgi:hypothetical protein
MPDDLTRRLTVEFLKPIITAFKRKVADMRAGGAPESEIDDLLGLVESNMMLIGVRDIAFTPELGKMAMDIYREAAKPPQEGPSRKK